MTGLQLFGLIITSLAALGGITWGTIRLIIKVVQYFVRSEESAKATAEHTKSISEQLASFMRERDERDASVDARFSAHEQMLAVLKYEMERGNGHARTTQPAPRSVSESG